MVVGDFDLVGVAVPPNEAQPPLIVDPNAVLALTIPSQFFESVAWKRRQHPEIIRRVEQNEFAGGQGVRSLEICGWTRDGIAARCPPNETT